MISDYYKRYEPLFGSWYITDKIGEGAYGQVYIIERTEMGVVYKSALKAMTIPNDKSEIKSVMSDGMSEAEATEYFKGLVQSIVNEFIMMSKLKGNSHIVSYEDHVLVEHEDDIGWDILIRMELLTPLVEYTAEKTMDEREVIKLGIDLCKALEFCRKYDIIHRDIKPENIFIAASGDYKIGDFGIAKTVEKTRVGLSRKGTYVYMAPEVYNGSAYGATVDIYSLGIVMYKLLNNNRTPFMPEYPAPITYDDREEALVRRIRGEEISEPKNGSGELKAIVLKACAFNYTDRYQSATDMRKALEKLFYGNDNIDNIEKTKNDVDYSHKKRTVIFAIAAVLAVAGIIYAAVPKIPEDIAGINENETIYIGDSLSPEYTVEPVRFADETISFASSDENVVTVDDNGVIKAENVGEAVLQLSAAGYSEKVTIKVIAKVTEISGVDDTITITEGNNEQVFPKLSPARFADEKITYKIKDASIAKVNDTGEITALAPGTTTLTISAGGCSRTIKIKVEEYVPPVQNYNSYSSGGSGKSGSSSSSGSSGSSGSGSGDGFFSNSDDEFF